MSEKKLTSDTNFSIFEMKDTFNKLIADIGESEFRGKASVSDISRAVSTDYFDDSVDGLIDALEHLPDSDVEDLLAAIGHKPLSVSEFNNLVDMDDSTVDTNEPEVITLETKHKLSVVDGGSHNMDRSTSDSDKQLLHMQPISLNHEKRQQSSATVPFDLSSTFTAKLIGLGGGGCNAVEHMVRAGIEGIDFICANTDAQALKNINADTVLHIGQSITKGLGAGANPEIGRQAAMEDRDRIQDLIEGADMLFITAGMGGGTGTGAIPVVAQIARDMGVLTVAVVTKPFPFEGNKRMRIAEAGIDELYGHVDSLITIPNEKLLSVLGKNISLLDAFSVANDVLRGAVQGIAELITNPGLINVDFADVRTIMSEMGLAMTGSGVGCGEDRAVEAAEMAISSPLLEDIDLAGARGILVNVTAGLNLSIGEFEEVGNVIRSFAADDAAVVVGTVIDDELDAEIRVTVVVAGLSMHNSSIVSLRPEPQYSITATANIAKKRPIAAAAKRSKKRQNFDSADIDYLEIPAFLRRQAD